MSNLEKEISELKQKLEAIEKRNAQVELHKKWETSFTRRFLLVSFTYLAVALYFVFIEIERPWLNAVVPALGFLLSTLTMPFFRKWWDQFKSP